MITGIGKTILDFLRRALETESIDALLIPVKAPGTSAYTWLLLKELSLLDHADPLPPVMTVQGGHALSTISKHGTADNIIAAMMRPCEIQAAVELFKLKQIDLDHIVLIGIDCPGAVPLTEYMTSPESLESGYREIFGTWEDSEILRPVCRVCQRFSLDSPAEGESETADSTMENASSDLHIGLVGASNGSIHLIPSTEKGRELLKRMDIPPQEPPEEWLSGCQKIAQLRLQKRRDFDKEWEKRLEGVQNLTAAFDHCINCHNCMRVCPICYCQQCYYDSQFMRLNPPEYMDRAEKGGALRFPLDTLQFHLGRMSHMVLSCVSCGACEDACPMNIPVAQIFSLVGDRTQQEFGYEPGRNRNEPLPLQSFLKEEFCEVETPCECEEKSTGKKEGHV